MTERWFRGGVIALACLALAGLFYPLFVGESIFGGAVSTVILPLREFALKTLVSGQLPLWHSYNGAGVPILAQSEAALLYPFTWLAAVMPPAYAISLSLMAHLGVAAAGMWAFMGRLHVPAFGRGVSAFAFGFSHFFLVRLGDYALVTTAAWLPWVLWAVFTVLVTGHRRDMRWMALFVALILLAGHLQMAVYCLLLAGLFAIFWLVRQTRQSWRRRLLILAMGLCLGLLIAMVQLLPVLELWGHSAEAEGLPFSTITQKSYLPEQALNLLSPNILGSPAQGAYYGVGDFTESALYIGLLPLVAAGLAVVGWVRSGLRRVPNEPDYFKIIPFCIVVATVAYVLALGDYTWIYAFLYEHWPTFNAFVVPARWHIWTVFALSVLAGIGTQIWQPGPRLFRLTRSAVMGAAGVAGAVGVVLFLWPVAFTDSGATETLLRALGYTALVGMITGGAALLQPASLTTSAAYQRWALVMIALVGVDLVLAAWGQVPIVSTRSDDRSVSISTEAAPRGYWPPNVEPEIQQNAIANLNLLSQHPLLNHQAALQIATVDDYLALLDGYPEHRPRLLQATYAEQVHAVDSAGLVPVDIPLVRAWLVESACWHPDAQTLIQAMLKPQWDPLQQVHLLGDGGCSLPDESSDSVGAVLHLDDQQSQLTLDLSVNRDAFLVLADSYYAGWHVLVDGEPADILPANLAFRAVAVPAGARQVTFTYAPVWLLPGAMCTIIGLVLLLLLFRLEQPTPSTTVEAV